MIRQHMDLQTVQSRLDRGFYLNKNNHKRFFRDLLLLFTNAIIFFPTTSPHHVAALQLRQLLTKHMPATPASHSKPETGAKQTDPVHSEPEKPVARSRQPGNNQVPRKSEPGKKQHVSRQSGTNPVMKKSETSKKENVSVHARPNKVGGKLERAEAKPHSSRLSTGNRVAEEKCTKKQLVMERPVLSRRSGRVGSGYLGREKKKSPSKEVQEDDSSDEDGNSGEIKKEKRRGERGRNNGRGNKRRPPSKSPVGRDIIGRGKRGRRDGGEPPPVVDSGQPRKRSRR